MSALETESDLEVIEHLDFDPELTCETREKESLCGKPAAWVARTRCCSHSWLICEKHRRMWVDAAKSVKTINCSWCRASGPTLDSIAEFIPIGGKP